MSTRRVSPFPKSISFTVIASGANTFTQLSIPVPSTLFTQSGGSITTIELIALEYNHIGQDQLLADADIFTIQLTTSSRTAIGTLGQTSTLYFNDFRANEHTLVGIEFYESRKIVEFGGQGGRGLLIASPQLFIGIQGTSLTTPVTVHGKIYYRIVQVDAREFAGLLAVQSAST